MCGLSQTFDWAIFDLDNFRMWVYFPFHNEGLYSDIALSESVDDYHLHVYEIEDTRYAMINAMSFFVEDESPAVLGSLFVSCDEVDTYVDAFVSDFKSFKNICQNIKKEMADNLTTEPILEITDFVHSDEELAL